MNEIRYETPCEDIDFGAATIFLAGPTVRGNQPHLTSWRNEAIKLFRESGFGSYFVGNLIIPEFTDSRASDQLRYDLPLWEFHGLKNCHVILFWVPRTKELIGLTTNHEHGYWMARDRDKMVYGHPKDAYRMSYLDIMWIETYKESFGDNAGDPIYTSLEKAVKASLDKLIPRYQIPMEAEMRRQLSCRYNKNESSSSTSTESASSED